MAQDQIPQPDLTTVLGPLLPALPAAALSTTPPDSILQLLSPILRQRVQLLSASAIAEPPAPQPSSLHGQTQHHQQQNASQDDAWIRLLCYDRSLGSKLQATAQSSALELHPVSGEVEVDWDYDSQIRYKRLDEETLQCLVVVERMGLAFRLVYCTEGWRVGEVTVIKQDESGGLFSVFGFNHGQIHKSLKEAEDNFKQSTTTTSKAIQEQNQPQKQDDNNNNDVDDDDDDDYWAQYDAAASTQATPQPQQQNSRNAASASNTINQPSFGDDDDDGYYAQYDTVQPAMDDHDPDEQVTGDSTLDGGSLTQQYPQQDQREEPPSLTTETKDLQPTIMSPEPEVVQPSPSRPDSSASSTTSVQKLEAVAQRLEQSEFGVKQHISRSIKSLYMLARASGIERQEFDRLVRIELEMLPMMDETD